MITLAHFQTVDHARPTLPGRRYKWRTKAQIERDQAAAARHASTDAPTAARAALAAELDSMSLAAVRVTK